MPRLGSPARIAAISLVLAAALFGFAGHASAYTPDKNVQTRIVSCLENGGTNYMVGQEISCSATVASSNTLLGNLFWSSSPPKGSFSSGNCTGLNDLLCSVTFTPSSTGSTSITASYGPDSLGNSGPASPGYGIAIGRASPGLSAFCSPTSLNLGTAATCTAQISNGYAVNGEVITFSLGQGSGAVRFPSGTTCSLQLETCHVAVTPVESGSAVIQATYPGDSNNVGPISQTVSLDILKTTSATTVSCTPSALAAGQQSTCTANVTGYSPGGFVTWQSNDPEGAFSASPCSLASGSCSVKYTAASSALISAIYQGDNNNTGSSGSFTILATVEETVQIAVANSGPATTLTLSGCSVSPTTFMADGTPHSFQANAGCSSMAAALPLPGPQTRYLAAGGLTSVPIPSCTSATCPPFSATIYFEVLNSYQVAPANPSSWSTSSSIGVTGTVLGSVGQTVCTIAVTAGPGQYSCQGWTDFGTQASMGALRVSADERWAAGNSSFTDETGGNMHDSSYFWQVMEHFQYSVEASSGAPSAPSLSYSSFGVPTSVPLVGSSSVVWLDSGSSWTAPGTLDGSSSTERWQSAVTGGAATAGQSVSLVYYHQYLVNFGFSVTGGGTAFVTPAVSFVSFGASTGGTQGWVDAGTGYAYTNPLAGSTSVERWFTAVPEGNVSGPGPVVPLYFHQFDLSLNFTVLGGGDYTDPRLGYSSSSVQELQQISEIRSDFWVDAGSQWSVSPTLPSSTGTERWVSGQATTGTATKPLDSELVYYHQYLGSIGYSVLEGGSPPSPSLGYVSLQQQTSAALDASTTQLWMDAGSSWGVPLTIPGGHGERWLSNVTVAAVVGGPFKTDVQYSHQFYVAVTVSTTSGGSVATPDQWTDKGEAVLLKATAAKLWSFSYWRGETPFSYNGTTAQPTLTVSGPANETAVFYPGLLLQTAGPGSVTYAYGSISGIVPPGSDKTIYPPPGRNVTLTAEPSGVDVAFGGWTGQLANSNQRSSVAIEAPGGVVASFAVDYGDEATLAVATLVIAAFAVYALVVRRGSFPKLKFLRIAQKTEPESV